ncbi:MULTISPECIES: O-antigen ligase family protein [Rhodanobacter]|uniref:O-antigen ligase family protein n=1 Tax=Rhodanobacter TaxID=75309 RepID=UPI00048A0FA4|nr:MULTISPECIES: O-antigen ligase family protein [Rhodanobacter]TAN16177.1 MAG: O-antigen ligase family protein [Rhodanobacter sp.]UJJ55148.1 O-antigen ligase family protein [Rhodanobacter thiooxydans]
MHSFTTSFKAALRSPLLPFWLVVALLPFGRSSELGTLLCLLGVIMLFARNPQALREHPGAQLLLWLLAAYTGAALFSAVDAIRPGKSWGTVVALLRYAPLGLYACFAIRREEKLLALYVAVAWVLALWCADAWLQALTGWSLGGHAEAERVSGIFGADNLKLGPTLAVLSPFALWAARRRWGLPGLLLAFALILGPVLLAGSRAAWLSYALVALGFAWREARSPWRFAGFCAVAAVLLALAGGIAWKTSTRFHDRMERTLLVLHGTDQSLDTALSGRLDIWHASIKMFAAHPINGVGVRGFRYAYPQYAPANDHFVATGEACGVGEGACHAHQLVLEILTETGTLGLALWLAAVALAWRAWRRVGAAARARAFPVTLALGVMLFPLNTHLAFYSAWWGLLFAWLLGLWCASLFVTGIPAGKEEPGIRAGLLKEARSLEARDGA